MQFIQQGGQSATNGESHSSSPRVSVVLPVHNGLPYLHESIQSILNQTLEDFEFIILDDGSTDGTAAALGQWQQKDSRIRTFQSEQKLGLARSSNYVVAKARAQLIARMDGDDIAHPDRLKRQWEVFKENSRAQLVGTLWEGIDARGTRVRPRDRWRLMRRSAFAPFPHGSVMFRRQAFDQIGGYRDACDYWEDLDLFLRMAATGQVLVIPDVLYLYRFHANGSRLAVDMHKVQKRIATMYRCLAERRAGRDYNHVLMESETEKDDRLKLHPASFTSIASARLWSGYSPRVLSTLWRSGALGWDPETALAVIWAAWGEISPSTLRGAIRSFIRVRDLVASYRMGDRRLHEWRFD